jgi:histidinol-phosphate aminotransferase
MLPLAGEAEADRITRECLKLGVIVRPLRAFGLPQCIRVSTGTDDENRKCVEAFERVLDVTV